MRRRFLRFLAVVGCLMCCLFGLFACELPNGVQVNGMTYDQIYQSAVEQGYEGTQEALTQCIDEECQRIFQRAHPDWSLEQTLNSLPEIVEIGVTEVTYGKDTGQLLLILKVNTPEFGDKIRIQVQDLKFPEGLLSIKLTTESGTKELTPTSLQQDTCVQIGLGEEFTVEFIFDGIVSYVYNHDSYVQVREENSSSAEDDTYSLAFTVTEVEFISEFVYTAFSLNYTYEDTTQTVTLPFGIDGNRGSIKAEFLGVVASNHDYALSNETPSSTFVYTIGEANFLCLCFNMPLKVTTISDGVNEYYYSRDRDARFYFFELVCFQEVGVYTMTFTYHNDRTDEWFTESFTVVAKEKEVELVAPVGHIWLSSIYSQTLGKTLYTNGNASKSFEVYAGHEIQVSLYMYGSEAFLTAHLDGVPIELFDIRVSIESYQAKFTVPILDSGEHTLVFGYCIPNRTYMASEEFSVYIENPEIVFAGIAQGSNDAPQKELTVRSGFSLYLCFNTHVTVESVKVLSGNTEIECGVMHTQGSLIGGKPREDYACIYLFGCGTDIESGRYEIKLQYLYLGETVTETFYLNIAPSV